MKIFTTVNDQQLEVELSHDPERENEYTARIGERKIHLINIEPKPGSLTLSVDGQVGFYEFNVEKDQINGVMYRNRVYRTSVKNPQQEQLEKLLAEFGAGMGGTMSETVLKAPMPGKILGLSVEVGQKIELGQVALVLEAMKMENEIGSTIEARFRRSISKSATPSPSAIR